MTSSNGNIFSATGLLRGNQRAPVNSLHKGQWRGALMFSFICAWTNGWANNRNVGDLRRHCIHFGFTVMKHLCMSMRSFMTSARISIRHLDLQLRSVLWTVDSYYVHIKASSLTISIHSSPTYGGCEAVCPEASFTNEVNPWLAKRPLFFNGRLADRRITSLVKETTGVMPCLSSTFDMANNSQHFCSCHSQLSHIMTCILQEFSHP